MLKIVMPKVSPKTIMTTIIMQLTQAETQMPRFGSFWVKEVDKSTNV